METDEIKVWLDTGSINIFGRPFAGKDTQGKALASTLNGVLLGGGEILRNSLIPPHVDTALRRGELIPSDDYVSIVLPYLSNRALSGKPLILSSVGRWVGEEKGVLEALATSNHPLKAVIYLDLSEDIVVARWKALGAHDDRGGRYDDTLEILQKRLAEYREKTLPVLDEYEKLGLLITIDGNQPVESVSKDILTALTNRALASQ